MHILYLVPRPNLMLSAPVGNAVRVRELTRGFQMNNDEVSTISAGEKRFARASTMLYRQQVKRILPGALSGLMHDVYDIGHDVLFRLEVQAQVERLPRLDFIVEEYTFYSEAGASVARKIGRPLILDDIVPIWEQAQYYERNIRGVGRTIQRRVFDSARVLVAVSSEIRDYLLSWDVPPEKIRLVGNGADCDRFRPGLGGDAIRESYGMHDKTVIGFVGSFAPWHGLDMLIAGARELLERSREVHFLIVGDGPQRTGLEKRVYDWKLGGSITFTGAVPYEKIPPLLDAMDIAVLPNTTTYCSPIKLFEYMAMEKAVVAPRYNPILEIVTDGKDGLLFAPGDQTEMIQMLYMLVGDESRRTDLGRNARRKIVEQYTWVKQADRLRNAVPA